MSIELMAIAECSGYTDGGFKATIRGVEVYGIFTIYHQLRGDGYRYPTDIIIGKGKKYPHMAKLIAKMVEEAYEEFKGYGKASRIEYWYDKHTRLWVIEVLDNRGYEITYGNYADTTHQIPKNSLDTEILDYMTEYSINPLNVNQWSNGKKINHAKWYKLRKERV